MLHNITGSHVKRKKRSFPSIHANPVSCPTVPWLPLTSNDKSFNNSLIGPKIEHLLHILLHALVSPPFLFALSPLDIRLKGAWKKSGSLQSTAESEHLYWFWNQNDRLSVQKKSYSWMCLFWDVKYVWKVWTVYQIKAHMRSDKIHSSFFQIFLKLGLI